ncbi:MAG: sulfite oxidase heme-binding subunit YedZ [Terriglobales bacterium]
MKPITWVKIAVFLLSIAPLGLLGWWAYQGDVTANPIEFITHKTGICTLVFLLLTLSVTPLRKLSGQLWLIQLRRMLGLFAFFYGCLHLSTYVVLDHFFDWDRIVADVYKRPFITAGFTGFLLMVPLALTSTNGMIRRLGGRRWQNLHRLVYASAIAGVVHFLWLVKADILEPAIYGAILALLLGYRVVSWMLPRLKARQEAAPQMDAGRAQ